MAVNKARRLGSFAPLSAHYYKDDAIAEAGEAAELLYVRGLAFCADVLSDGFISKTQLVRFVGVGMRDAQKRAEQLVEVGLWVREGNGYRVAAWLKWNRSKAEISEIQRKDADRKADKTPEEAPPPPEEDDDSERNPNGIRSESSDDHERSPNGIQPRARTPRHVTPRNDNLFGPDGPDAGASDDASVTPQAVVAAWVEAVKADGGPTLDGGMCGQVGREAKKLLGDGADPAVVLEAARSIGQKGLATLSREHTSLAKRGRLRAVNSGPRHDPKTGRAVDW